MEMQPVQMIGVGSPVIDLIAEVEDDLLQAVNGEKVACAWSIRQRWIP